MILLIPPFLLRHQMKSVNSMSTVCMKTQEKQFKPQRATDFLKKATEDTQKKKKYQHFSCFYLMMLNANY